MKMNFYRRNEVLYCEEVAIPDLCHKFGTPAFVYSRSEIEQNFCSYQRALSGQRHLICYAVKANSNLAIINLLARLGSGFDIVSRGELHRVIAAGGDASKVVFSGVGKTPLEIKEALKMGIKCFNVESKNELKVLEAISGDLDTVAPISIRVNPNIDANTHPYISTGLKENKFGVPPDEALKLYQIANESRFLHPTGIDCHIGSQIVDLAPFQESLTCLLSLVDKLDTQGIRLQHIDVGGGLGVSYGTEHVISPEIMIKDLLQHLAGYDSELIIEPGRSIVANAGALLTEVLFLKESEDRRFAVVDAAMNDLIRPSLYEAWQDIQPVKTRTGDALHWDIVGPICESADFLGKSRSLCLAEGDLLSIMDSGAYGFAMASNYNSRPRAIEIMVDRRDIHVIGERESLTELWAREHLLQGIED